jgi:hypothetical protein
MLSIIVQDTAAHETGKALMHTDLAIPVKGTFALAGSLSALTNPANSLLTRAEISQRASDETCEDL